METPKQNLRSHFKVYSSLVIPAEAGIQTALSIKNNLKKQIKNGICRITVSRVSILRQILGWIKAVFYV